MATSRRKPAALEPADTSGDEPAAPPPGGARGRSKAPSAARVAAGKKAPAEPRARKTAKPVRAKATPAKATSARRPADGANRAPAHRVAVVIPAKDESRSIAATVRAARAIPHVDLVLVVDDGSEDGTQDVARSAGAVVVRHSHNRGKASAMETGAAVVAMRDVEEGPARMLLFLDGDLGESAVNATPLVSPVLGGEADCSIALIPPQPGAGGRGIVVGLARRSIQAMTGWTPTQPLSGMRCLTRGAFEAATPLAHGWGVETGMTIDLLDKGFRVVEVPCALRHRPSGTDLRGQMHRAAQYRDVMLAVNTRRVRRVLERRRPGRSREPGTSSGG